jgi:opacity protein-like surface antigen
MREKTIIVGLIIALFGSTGYALDPLGPPKALLKEGQWSVGLEYAYSQTNTELEDGSLRGTPLPDRSSQLRANEAFVNLRYGPPLHGVVDVFGRLGVVAFKDPTLQDGDADIAFGLGAAATVWKTGEKLDWGALVQFGRGESSTRGSPSSEIEAWSLQMAAGPTYQIRDDMALYGGLFLDFLWGEFEGSNRLDWDMEQNDPFGVFVGLDWTVKENADWTVEFQYAGSTLAIATGLRWTFD